MKATHSEGLMGLNSGNVWSVFAMAWFQSRNLFKRRAISLITTSSLTGNSLCQMRLKPSQVIINLPSDSSSAGSQIRYIKPWNPEPKTSAV